MEMFFQHHDEKAPIMGSKKISLRCSSFKCIKSICIDTVDGRNPSPPVPYGTL